MRFMINPGGPTGLVTELSAVKLHLAIRMILAAVKLTTNLASLKDQ